MYLIYADKFTNLNIFVMKVAQRCLDNGDPAPVLT